MTKRSELAGKKKQAAKRQKLLEGIWGEELTTTPVWDRKKNDGFITIPRTLPHIMRLMDKWSEKGKPVSSTYFALWCRTWDDGCLEIKDKADLAHEAGFSGQRAIYSLAQRMRILQNLGFIKFKQKGNNEFQYVLIVNPLSVIQEKADAEDDDFKALKFRMDDVGAEWPTDEEDDDFEALKLEIDGVGAEWPIDEEDEDSD